MAKLRQQQHRPARDTKRAREVADLKRENNKLARQNARLRKQAERAERTRDAFEDVSESPESTTAPSAAQNGAGSPSCTTPDCSGVTRLLSLGPFTFRVCPECKARSRVS